jgi:hypothetical protein
MQLDDGRICVEIAADPLISEYAYVILYVASAFVDVGQ